MERKKDNFKGVIMSASMRVVKRAITLLEMMIVIFIIGIIGSVVGYSMKGSLNEGRAFKSEQGSKQVYDLLMLGLADGERLSHVIKSPEDVIDATGLIRNPKKLIKDGWNQKFQIKSIGNNDIVVYSSAWHKYLVEKKKLSYEQLHESYPWAFTEEQEDNL